MANSGPRFDLRELRFEPLADRPSKMRMSDLGRPEAGGGSLEDWLDGLPKVLAAQSLKQLRDAIVTAHSEGCHVLAALGGHVIKTGCGPYLKDWVIRGVLTGMAINGSAAIHDLELAVAGHTSEDVGERLGDGPLWIRTRDLGAVRRRMQPGCRTRDGPGSGRWGKSSWNTADPASTPACSWPVFGIRFR